MMGGKHLLLLAVFVILARCQKPQVVMSPYFKTIFSGDIFYLKCADSTGSSNVTWYLNDNKIINEKDKSYKIAAAHPSHSGSYICDINNIKSDPFTIEVLEYMPFASLTMQTGQPVMQTGASVILNIQNDDGLQGWYCWVYRGDKVKKIILKKTNESNLDFQTRSLEVPETIFWCTDKKKERRSNTVTVRTSEKQVSLEMDALPAVDGESLTLRCLVWGTNNIKNTVFYKNNIIISTNNSPTLRINPVRQNKEESYKCNATFTYIARTDGPPYIVESDAQSLPVQAPPFKPHVSEGMFCSCEHCPKDPGYRWYYEKGNSWEFIQSGDSMTPDESGTYACRAVWKLGRSALSEGFKHEARPNYVLPIVLILLLILFLAVVGFYAWYRKRNTTAPVYEDVALRSRDKAVGKGDPEYDTINPEAQDRKNKEGEYEPLKKGEMKEGEYQTLGMEVAAGGDGGYQALKKEATKEGEYQTLGAAGASGGEGGYQELKKGELKEGVYHTLSKEGTPEGEGGYQALKKGEMKEGVYHTLSKEGAAGGEGGYEAVGKENKDKEYETVDEKKEPKAN